ncbi:hypothetical protein [Phenylobacterium sp.]|uniref:hypothetical protein n=1 Tax=Phenylobacterium sp. TaxID=1871053 RepID=UPI002F92210F
MIDTVPAPLLIAHVAAGGVAILAGFGALTARKGGGLHRTAGHVFFGAMLLMAASAAVMSLLGPQKMALGSLFVMYLVATGWQAARTPPGQVGLAERAGFVAAAAFVLAIGVLTLLGAATTGDGVGGGVFLTAIGGLCAYDDLSVIRRGGLVGSSRLARHIWRMSAACFVATGSFFLGQQEVMPEEVRGSPMLFVLAFAPLAVMAYWLLKTRARRRRSPSVAAA